MAECALLIPVKPLLASKQRLADYLSPAQRSELAWAMLSDMLDELRQRPLFDVIVLSKDKQIQQLATAQSVPFLAEPEPCQSLNEAVSFALSHLSEQYRKLLIIHGDIPLIAYQDVEFMLHQASADVVLVSDSKKTGTNAMLLNLPTAFLPLYGDNSFQRHQHQAEQLALTCQIMPAPSIAHDMDELRDLQYLIQTVASTSATGRCLRQLDLGINQ